MGAIWDYLRGANQKDKDYDDYELTPRDKAAIKVAKEKERSLHSQTNHNYRFYAYCTECGQKTWNGHDTVSLDYNPKDGIWLLQHITRGCGRFNHIARVELVDMGFNG